jgi:hypothetical protein
MSCEELRAALEEYIDGNLDPQRRAAVDQHLGACMACQGLVGDLHAIRRTARALNRHVPPPAVWTRIAAELSTASARPTYSQRRWMPLAAAAALAAAVGGSVYFSGRRVEPPAANPAQHAESTGQTSARQPEPAAPGPVTPDDLMQSVETEMQLAEEHYEKAIAGLEQIAKAEERTLDPQLAATLKRNLGVIDQAISESRAALRTQPASEPAQESLFEAFRSKLALLQDTIALINEMRKGNQSETAPLGVMDQM